METKQLAMLMDFENLVIGVENNEQDSQRIFSAKKIIDYLESNYGRVVFRKAFADWSNTKFRKYTADMMRCGIEMQHIIRNGYNNKNYAESHMVIQAMDCIIRNPQIDTFVLATGDADFLPLISHLKSTGRNVIGLGTEGTVAGALLSNCDEFIYYGGKGLRKAAQNTADKGAVIKNLKTIIGNAGVYVDDIEDELLDIMPDFSLEALGCEDILAFLATLPSLIRIDYSGSEPKAFWISGPPQRTQRPNNKNEYNAEMLALPLDEYMKATRWYIVDGQIRETVLTNIYNILADTNKVMVSDDLRQEVAADLDDDLDDKAWQGTIFSLVCGSCLWEKPESPDMPLHLRKLSLFKNVRDLDDFMLGYYTSLFHKAFMERQDITPENMTHLMHPEDEDGHIALFEKVYDDMADRR